ncbi:hypothetical protein [Arthrobacter sp. PM3]|uniref:hypothetical protein n=1 Tax=Arthrobacter sp. PM3 TaxID=2017685 RepID=UPI0037BF1626
MQVLKNNSDSRRDIMSVWNLFELQEMSLPPEPKRQLSETRFPQCPVKNSLAGGPASSSQRAGVSKLPCLVSHAMQDNSTPG